jgi:alkylation response protein AidB-like acyl-CoA dehydrogenase
MILDAFTRLLEAHCPPSLVRAALADPSAVAGLEAEIGRSGFLDVLRGEADGGGGLTLAEFAPLVMAAGAFLLPLDFAGRARARATGAAPDEVARAALMAALMAGAMGRVLEMTIAHVTTRRQFGRPLAGFQAVQQQLAVMAEEVAAATLAAHIGLAGPGFAPERSAAAKLRANEAAELVAASAHQLHGAIGATLDFDLQLWTGALRRWQRDAGTASHWAVVLARHRLAAAPADSAAYIRSHLQPGETR